MTPEEQAQADREFVKAIFPACCYLDRAIPVRGYPDNAARIRAAADEILRLRKQLHKSGSVPAALALLAEWLDTEMDPEDDEYAPWMENFTARVRAALEGHKPNCDHPVVRQTITDVHELRIDTETRCTECGELLKSHSSERGV